MNREKIVNQVKTLLRSTSFTDADLTEAREQIKREDYAKSEEVRKPLFDRAVAAIRRGESTTQVAGDLDTACEKLGLDSFEIAVQARAHLEKIQTAAWKEAVQLCRSGSDASTVIDRLMKQHGFAWFDAQQVANRAQKAAEQAA